MGISEPRSRRSRMTRSVWLIGLHQRSPKSAPIRPSTSSIFRSPACRLPIGCPRPHRCVRQYPGECAEGARIDRRNTDRLSGVVAGRKPNRSAHGVSRSLRCRDAARQAEPWFPRTTPVMIFGVAPSRIKEPGLRLLQWASRARGRQVAEPAVLRYRNPGRAILARRRAPERYGLLDHRQDGCGAIRRLGPDHFGTEGALTSFAFSKSANSGFQRRVLAEDARPGLGADMGVEGRVAPRPAPSNSGVLHDLLRVADEHLQMPLVAETLGIDLVHGFRAGRTRREPAA